MSEQPHPSTAAQPAEGNTSIVLIVIAWLIVLIPLGYGLIQTVIRAANLFTG